MVGIAKNSKLSSRLVFNFTLLFSRRLFSNVSKATESRKLCKKQGSRLGNLGLALLGLKKSDANCGDTGVYDVATYVCEISRFQKNSLCVGWKMEPQVKVEFARLQDAGPD